MTDPKGREKMSIDPFFTVWLAVVAALFAAYVHTDCGGARR